MSPFLRFLRSLRVREITVNEGIAAQRVKDAGVLVEAKLLHGAQAEICQTEGLYGTAGSELEGFEVFPETKASTEEGDIEALFPDTDASVVGRQSRWSTDERLPRFVREFSTGER